VISSSIAKNGNPHATNELSPPEGSEPMDRVTKCDDTDRTVSTDFDHDYYDDDDDNDDASNGSAILPLQRNPRNDPEQPLQRQQQQQQQQQRHQVDEQLIRGLCNLDIRSSLNASPQKKETLRKKIFKPIQSLGRKQQQQQQQQQPEKQPEKQPQQRKSKRHIRTHSGGLVFPNLRIPLRVGNRRKVSFAKPKDFSIIEDDTPRQVEDLWYSEKDYGDMKLEALRTFHEIITSDDAMDEKDRFVESDHKTARGLEATTKKMVAERRKYKIASRFVVFDEQEEQRLCRTRDHGRIRALYGDATSRSRTTARDTARKDEEEMRLRNNWCSAQDITNAVRIEYGWL